jgi:uncharacterized protein YkwD
MFRSIKILPILAPALLLAACSLETFSDRAPDRAPAFYTDLAAAGAKLEPASARDMISLYRRNNGLETLEIDSGLMAEAQRQADAMASADKLSHEVRGSLNDRLNKAGYQRFEAVENVSAGYHTVAEAFSGWRQSPPHNSNMLAKGMKRMGIAAAYNPRARYKVFWALVLTN